MDDMIVFVPAVDLSGDEYEGVVQLKVARMGVIEPSEVAEAPKDPLLQVMCQSKLT